MCMLFERVSGWLQVGKPWISDGNDKVIVAVLFGQGLSEYSLGLTCAYTIR
jgi:hypothetical protein